jgi:hypothetical protein
MAAELPQERKESLLPPPAPAAQQEAEGHLKVYRRCPKRHVRRRKCILSPILLDLFVD